MDVCVQVCVVVSDVFMFVILVYENDPLNGQSPSVGGADLVVVPNDKGLTQNRK